jgi:UDP-N-acetylmuramyl pentapeptide phosphotransferase/UDP-N-acetylglucosamine-1-phosphate transferase
VYVAAVYVHFAYLFALQCKAETQYTVCRRVLGTYVYDVLVIVQNLQLLDHLGKVPVLLYLVFAMDFLFCLAFETDGVDGLAGVIVLAQGVSYPVVAQVETSHVGVPRELDAVEIEHFAFV